MSVYTFGCFIFINKLPSLFSVHRRGGRVKTYGTLHSVGGGPGIKRVDSVLYSGLPETQRGSRLHDVRRFQSLCPWSSGADLSGPSSLDASVGSLPVFTFSVVSVLVPSLPATWDPTLLGDGNSRRHRGHGWWYRGGHYREAGGTPCRPGSPLGTLLLDVPLVRSTRSLLVLEVLTFGNVECIKEKH